MFSRKQDIYDEAERENKKFEQEVALRAGAGPYIALLLVLFIPAGALALHLWLHKGEPQFATYALPFLIVFFLAELLASLLLVARWFQRLTTNSDIEELRKMAFSYRLGGALALRPFLNPEGEKLIADSLLAAYRRGIIEPNFYKSATNPPFFLALVLVVSLGLFAFYAPTFGLVERPVIPLLGPEFGAWDWHPPAESNGAELKPIIAYSAGALVCLAFAFAGALVWAVIYLTRRMALRDVTAYTYQEVTMRLVASAIVALVVYHILAPMKPSPGIPWGETLMVLSFGAGIMPETVLRWVGNKASHLFGAQADTDDVDLEHIHGISPFTRARLVEVGVYDAQGLVATNPLRLSLHTPYPLPQIMDWIGQAFILLQFQKEGMEKLRKQGIRTIWELEAAITPPSQADPGDAELSRGLAALAANPS